MATPSRRNPDTPACSNVSTRFWGLDALARQDSTIQNCVRERGMDSQQHDVSGEEEGGFANVWSSIKLRHMQTALRARHSELWQEILPNLGDGKEFRSVFASLARSEAYRSLFAGAHRQPFLLPHLQCVTELLTLDEVARGLQKNTWPGNICPYSSALFIFDGHHVKSAMPLPAVDNERLLCDCLQYGTVMVMHSGSHWRKLGALAFASVKELQIPSNNTIFLTGGGRDYGLNMHTDNHNVLILQTEGTKRWIVWDPPPRKHGPDPLARGKNYDNIDRHELGEPLLDVELRPGQCLCVPMGFPHLTDTLGSDIPSLHVTLSMYPTPTYSSLRLELLSQLRVHDFATNDSMSDSAYWDVTRFVPVGCLAPNTVRQQQAPGIALGNFVAEELLRRAAAIDPDVFIGLGEVAQWESACAVVESALRSLLSTLEVYERGFCTVANSIGEFPTTHPHELLAAFGCSTQIKERNRIDPEDGVPRTWGEIVQRYHSEYRVEIIEEYWRTQCTPVMDDADGEPARIDPADGNVRTLSDLKHINRLSMTDDEIELYWYNKCHPIHDQDTLPPDHVDRADRAANDAYELLRLLEERMPHLRVQCDKASMKYSERQLAEVCASVTHSPKIFKGDYEVVD